MGHSYSLVHLTDIACPPPDFIRAAAQAGYDAVSLRTIPLGLPQERPYNLAKDPELLRETKRALKETGIQYTDTEIARIADGIEVKEHEPALAVAAEMGVTHILTNLWSRDKGRCLEQFVQLCDLAEQYGQDVNVEFVTWASIADLRQTKELLLASKKKNVGVVVDTLHFHRSGVALAELDDCPKEWFRYAHLCDAGGNIPTQEEELARVARSERLYPGEGDIPILDIISRIPNQDITYGLEVPHGARLKELGLVEYASRVLRAAKACMGEE